MHTLKAHGVDKYELRELAGLCYSDPITPLDDRARRSEISRAKIDTGGVSLPHPGKGLLHAPPDECAPGYRHRGCRGQA
jgi:hypothetical protein